jgi:hypothetical protein
MKNAPPAIRVLRRKTWTPPTMKIMVLINLMQVNIPLAIKAAFCDV